jgi:hypothetical protein
MALDGLDGCESCHRSLLVFLSAMRVADLTSAGRALLSVGAIGLGIAGISKITFLFLSLGLLAVADLYRIVDRRAPALALVCLASSAATIGIVGQQLSDFPAFVAMGVDNVRHFSSTNRPEWLLFTPGSIDGRHPASAEGAQWPLFLRHYEPVDRVQQTLILKQRAESLPDLLGERQLVQARIGDTVPVPPVDAPQFVTITVRRSVIGSLVNLLFKAPRLPAAAISARNCATCGPRASRS